MQTLREYKCPCCGGAIAFDSASQTLKCPYCDTEFEPETLSEYEHVLKETETETEHAEWEKASNEWLADDTERLCTYVCRSCGGEIVGDETTAATSCPFCGNHVVMENKLSGQLKPDLVIPFRLDKNAAVANLKKHFSGKRLLPKAFKDENRLDEIQGVYVPFWLFDTDVRANIRYRATRIRTWSDSRYDYTETSHYAVSRGGTLGFDHVPVDGSSKMANDLTESLEPYDLSEAVDFNAAYLAGYLANRYDVGQEESTERANERVKRSTERAFGETVNGYATLVPESSNIRLSNGKVRYALFPVWILNTNTNGKTYTFAMNGQTGKLVGDLPCDTKAAWKWFFGLTAACGAGLYLFLTLLGATGAL